MRIIIALLMSLLCLGRVFSEVPGGGGLMQITSPEFKHNQLIPRKFTCQGDDLNPALIIENTPEGSKSLVLIVDDPDAPMGNWDHWIVYDIEPGISRVEENSIPGKQGMNDFKRLDYGGPCPPSGTHRYFFKIYALDAMLNLEEGVSKEEIEEVMQGHILDKAELVGLYKKS
ncbi:MAG: YbhB/YbcL family Raf kinase inhibitor-like protein [Candidatus Omnitrophota bacterium]